MAEAKERLVRVTVNEVSLVDDGDNPPAKAVLWKRRGPGKGKAGYVPGKRRSSRELADLLEDVRKQTKRVGGQDLPARAFAFVPDADTPSTWRLPLFEKAADVSANRPSVRRTADAAQALSTKGFRGQRVRVPNDKRATVVRRVRAAWLRARRNAGQDVSSEDLPQVLKREVRKLVAQTQRQATGGGALHRHLVDLPDGPITPGTFITSENDEHNHDLIIPAVMNPGETVELNTTIANQPPPEGVEPHIHRVRFTVTSVVESRYVKRMEAMTRHLGLTDVNDVPDAVAKRLFDEVREESLRDQAADSVMRRLSDFAQSVREIFFGLTEEGESRTMEQVQADVVTSLGQLVDNMTEQLPEILAGRIAKVRDVLKDDASEDEVALAIEDALVKWCEELNPDASGSGSPSPAAGSGKQTGETMDPKTLDKSKLDGLDKDTRAFVDKALEAADQVETLTAKVAELETKLTEKKKDPDEGDDIYASLPDPLQKHLRKRDEELAEARAENIELRTTHTRDALRKRLTFKALPGSDELLDVMVVLSEDHRAKLEGVLKAADEAVRKGGDLTVPIGDDAAGDATQAGASAYAAIVAAGDEVRKLKPELTPEAARAEAIKLQPELYDNYRTELAASQRH